MNQIEWLKHNGAYLKINRIEKELKIPQGTIKKYVSGERGLAERWHERVNKWVSNFRKNPAP